MIETFTEELRDGTVVEFVRIERAKDEYSIMTKANYDAIQASSTLPSNSSDFSQPIGGNE
jgi:hypothetical protein